MSWNFLDITSIHTGFMNLFGNQRSPDKTHSPSGVILNDSENGPSQPASPSASSPSASPSASSRSSASTSAVSSSASVSISSDPPLKFFSDGRPDPVMAMVDKRLSQAQQTLQRGHPLNPRMQSLSVRNPLPITAQANQGDPNDPYEQVRQKALEASKTAQIAAITAIKEAKMLSQGTSTSTSAARGIIGEYKEIKPKNTSFGETKFNPILTYQVKIAENTKDTHLKLYMNESGRFAMKIGSIDKNGNFVGIPVNNQQSIRMSSEAKNGLIAALRSLDNDFTKKQSPTGEFIGFRRVVESIESGKDNELKELSTLSFRNINTITSSKNAKEGADRTKGSGKQSRPESVGPIIGEGHPNHFASPPRSPSASQSTSSGSGRSDDHGPFDQRAGAGARINDETTARLVRANAEVNGNYTLEQRFNMGSLVIPGSAPIPMNVKQMDKSMRYSNAQRSPANPDFAAKADRNGRLSDWRGPGVGR